MVSVLPWLEQHRLLLFGRVVNGEQVRHTALSQVKGVR
jgi:hypothetical protein